LTSMASNGTTEAGDDSAVGRCVNDGLRRREEGERAVGARGYDGIEARESDEVEACGTEGDAIAGAVTRSTKGRSRRRAAQGASESTRPRAYREVSVFARMSILFVTVSEEEGDCNVCLEMRADKRMRRLMSGELTDYRVVRTRPKPLHC
jgi:hypothetical protein